VDLGRRDLSFSSLALVIATFVDGPRWQERTFFKPLPSEDRIV
jgi:hypothetical protein